MSVTPKWALREIREAKEYNLKELDLSRDELYTFGKRLTEIPAEVFELEQLEQLNLRHNSLTSIPKAISRLHNLTSLDIGGNYLETLPDWLAQLHNLTLLDISSNRLTTLPDWLAQLHKLTFLAVGDNHLTTLPTRLAQLHELTSLYLWHNQFSAIPDVVYELSSLEALMLFENRIKEISPKILQLEKLKALRLDENPIETPPPEVAYKGIEAIKDYFVQIQAQGEDRLYEAKLLIVGEPGAGKTSLANKILDPKYRLQDEKTTRGIDVMRWQFTMPDGKPFRVNIWDFGGQEIYHATHQFFLTKRSLYLLVADTRRQDTDFY